VPDSTTLNRFLRRLDLVVLKQALTAAVSQLPALQEGSPTAVAVDATGLAPGAISTFFVKRAKDRGDGFEWRHWLTWMIAIDIGRRLVVAQTTRRSPYNDGATRRPLVDAASQWETVELVQADAEFDSERHHQHIRHHIGADSVIPAKRGKADWQMTGIRAEMRHSFPHQLYRQRALAESVCSSVKRKLSAQAPGRSVGTQRAPALLLGLAYDIYCI
jgi:hypothetical protein